MERQKQNPKLHQQQTSTRITASNLKTISKSLTSITTTTTIFLLLLTILLASQHHFHIVQGISIKPADFDRLIMYCYLGGPAPMGSYDTSSAYQQQSSSPNSRLDVSNSGRSQFSPGSSGSMYQQQQQQAQQPSYFGGGSSSSGLGDLSQASQGARISSSANSYLREGGFSHLGQSIPRANTIDNFIALVSKIESASPRLATNPDQLIRVLLGRFRMDNFYYDVRARTSIDERDHRVRDIIPALLNSTFQQQQIGGNMQMASSQYLSPMDDFQENLLDGDEKCSMYFMLSHFIVKDTPNNPPLSAIGVAQTIGPLGGQRPPSLQAAGSGFPAQSGAATFGNSGVNARYPGPSPSFGSPATNNMNSFAGNLNNQAEYTGSNPAGINTLQPNFQFNQNLNNIRNQGPYSGTITSNSKNYQVPYVDVAAANGIRPGYMNRDDKVATEFGVVTVPNQNNAAIVLNRVLMGILASNVMSQPIRQLASVIYSNKYISATAKLDDDIDPLYAVTLADLWATSAIPKAGKPFDFKMLGDNGHWNDTMCPTTFTLDRSNSIRFTTAELLGGLDGFNLGMVRKELLARGRNLRLSDLLKMYYSHTGFRPHFAEYGVCSRATGINTHLDDLRRQADNYLRLYQLDAPTNDNDVAVLIMRLDSFKEFIRTATQQYTPIEICQDSSSSMSNSGYNDIYPNLSNDAEQCEIGKADIVSVLDTSPQANDLFMNLVLTKLANKIGLSRYGNTFTILTNQQDSIGYAGAYSFNAILRNSTNTAEIGCSLTHDTTRSYQGGQITDPTRLIEMFERALINLDTEYLVRQNMGQQQYNNQNSINSNSRYVSLLYNNYDYGGMPNAPRPKNTGGAKVIIWFNFGSQGRQSSIGSGPTNWNNDRPTGSIYPTGSNNNNNNLDYKFWEAKRYLRENFRGAAILAVSSNSDEVKAYVHDHQRDIFTDLPDWSSNANSAPQGADYYPGQSSDPASMAQLSGPADILANKLLQRMCEIPALFQYPLCFRVPSENVPAVGYISPRRKQYWMMSPKSFFSSSSVRMAFRVDGGRLRVCFGRMPKPDESAMRNPQYQQFGYQQQAIPINQQGGLSLISPGNGHINQYGNMNSQQQQQTTPPSTSYPSNGDNYYTGLEYGVCKDLSPGQEVDFIVDDPCYKKPIADCEPFYFVIKEITNPGEGDPNYMCRDVGCKRFDQVKFTMTHTGVACSAAYKSIKASWILIMISIATTVFLTRPNSSEKCFNQSSSMSSDKNNNTTKRQIRKSTKPQKQQNNYLINLTLPPIVKKSSNINHLIVVAIFSIIQQAQAQLSAPADYGQNRYGEKRGNFTPSEVLAIILLIMTIVGGLALTIGLCYYVNKRNSQGMQKVPQNDFS